MGAEESDLQVWEILAFTLKHRDAALIVDNFVSDGSFLFGEKLAGYIFKHLDSIISSK